MYQIIKGEPLPDKPSPTKILREMQVNDLVIIDRHKQKTFIATANRLGIGIVTRWNGDNTCSLWRMS